MSTVDPSHAELERLFVNNPELDALQAGLNRFNPIRTMGMAHMEIRHSAILGWLLDPQETHGLGDTFLRAFLAEALRGHEVEGAPSSLAVSQADLSDAEVRREWRNIDLLVVSEENRWVFVIENKFHSVQRTNQLSDYLRTARSVFAPEEDDGRTICGIFLTLHDEEPDDPAYAPIRYETICELLPRFVNGRARPLAPEVETFLRHYLEVLEEATDMSEEQSEMVELAKRLYRDHRKVLDFVVEHGTTTDFALAAETVFGADFETKETVEIDEVVYALGELKKSSLFFLPDAWCEAMNGDLSWPGCENYYMQYPVALWFRLVPYKDEGQGRLRLLGEVGPIKDYNLRKRLIEDIAAVGGQIRFQKDAADEGRRYSRFLKDNTITVQDMQDNESIAAAMRRLLNDFRSTFESLTPVLRQLREHGYEAKKNIGE